MPNYRYKARDRFGKAVSGVTIAQDRDAAARKLQDMGYLPISIEELRELSPGKLLVKIKHVSLEELSAFTRQLYSLQKAGLPLITSLDAIAKQIKNRYFKIAIEEISRNVQGGLSFSSSLKQQDRIFNEIYVNMIKAAESGGNLIDILERLTGLIEQEIDTRARVKAATRYPLLAFFVLCLAFLIVVTFVIPRFAVIYSQFKAVLPLPTRILIGINLLVKKFWYLFILIIGMGVFIFLRFIHSSSGRPLWDNFKLKIPVLGPLVTILVMSRFARVTAILMKSGVPILEVMDLVSHTTGNIIIARAIGNIKESVNQGKGISEPMKVSGLFPAVVIQMVAAGEQSGRIDDLLLGIADYYDRESGYLIKNLTTYIEPLLIFVLALMVLLLALAIFLPMWNLIRLFRPA